MRWTNVLVFKTKIMYRKGFWLLIDLILFQETLRSFPNWKPSEAAPSTYRFNENCQTSDNFFHGFLRLLWQLWQKMSSMPSPTKTTTFVEHISELAKRGEFRKFYPFKVPPHLLFQKNSKDSYWIYKLIASEEIQEPYWRFADVGVFDGPGLITEWSLRTSLLVVLKMSVKPCETRKKRSETIKTPKNR